MVFLIKETNMKKIHCVFSPIADVVKKDAEGLLVPWSLLHTLFSECLVQLGTAHEVDVHFFPNSSEHGMVWSYTFQA